MSFTFSLTDCTPCPVRSRRTKAVKAARTLTLRPLQQDAALRELRERQKTEEWKHLYAWLSGIPLGRTRFSHLAARTPAT